jgi:hypothetical protein
LRTRCLAKQVVVQDSILLLDARHVLLPEVIANELIEILRGDTRSSGSKLVILGLDELPPGLHFLNVAQRFQILLVRALHREHLLVPQAIGAAVKVVSWTPVLSSGPALWKALGVGSRPAVDLGRMAQNILFAFAVSDGALFVDLAHQVSNLNLRLRVGVAAYFESWYLLFAQVVVLNPEGGL